MSDRRIQAMVMRMVRACLVTLSLAVFCVPSWAQENPAEFGNGLSTELPVTDAGEMEFDFELGDFDNFGDPDFDPPLELNPEELAENMQGALAWAAIVVVVSGVLSLAILAGVAYLLSDALRVVPESYREMSPAAVWLLLVPLVNLVVMVWAFGAVPRSLCRYLQALGDASVVDCGQKLGLWGSILTLLVFPAPIGGLLLVLSLIKIRRSARQVQLAEANHP